MPDIKQLLSADVILTKRLVLIQKFMQCSYFQVMQH